MLQVAGREKEGTFLSEDIHRFSCTELRIIDQLWVKYSNGRFGFSIQKQIWQSLSGNIDMVSDGPRFGERVGWYIDHRWLASYELTFSLSAPVGHLPTPVAPTLRGASRRWLLYSLFSRLAACKL
jgi:hypothetical protein